MGNSGPNSRFDFDDELMQGYSNLNNATDFRSTAEIDNSKLNIYNHQNPDIANMEREADQLIQLSGAPTLIYLRTNDMGQVDDVFDENANPTYCEYTNVKGLFTPESASMVKVKWGIDVDLKFKIHYSRARLLSQIGSRLIRQGDVIAIPHNTLIQTQATEYLEGKDNRLDKFRVVGATDTGNFNYRWLYWTCTVEPLSGDITVRPKI